MSNLGAIVLAGGKSSRMGTDKALLEINGQPLLQKTCEVAQICGANPIYIITSWQERYKFLNLPEECKFINEPNPCSPLSGFILGLSNIKTDWVLLLACDLPNLRADILKIWASQLIDLPEQAIAYLPSYQQNMLQSKKYWEPLCGFYRWQCRDSLIKFMTQGGRSFQKWLDHQEVVEIPNVPESMLFNCNTPEDLRSLNYPT